MERVASVGGVVYHDVTERKWAEKAVDGGVAGLIAVNERAGGHAGPLSAAALLDEVGDLGLPVVCAGGIATADDFARALRLGYAGVQIGTRLIATDECSASPAYKQAIVEAAAADIVLSEKVTGVPLAVLRTPYVEAMGTRVGPLGRRLSAREAHAALDADDVRTSVGDTTGASQSERVSSPPVLAGGEERGGSEQRRAGGGGRAPIRGGRQSGTRWRTASTKAASVILE